MLGAGCLAVTVIFLPQMAQIFADAFFIVGLKPTQNVTITLELKFEAIDLAK